MTRHNPSLRHLTRGQALPWRIHPNGTSVYDTHARHVVAANNGTVTLIMRAVNSLDDLIDEIRRLCPDCRTPAQNHLLDGYTCPAHWPLLVGQEMPTVGEL